MLDNFEDEMHIETKKHEKQNSEHLRETLSTRLSPSTLVTLPDEKRLTE